MCWFSKFHSFTMLYIGSSSSKWLCWLVGKRLYAALTAITFSDHIMQYDVFLKFSTFRIDASVIYYVSTVRTFLFQNVRTFVLLSISSEKTLVICLKAFFISKIFWNKPFFMKKQCGTNQEQSIGFFFDPIGRLGPADMREVGRTKLFFSFPDFRFWNKRFFWRNKPGTNDYDHFETCLPIRSCQLHGGVKFESASCYGVITSSGFSEACDWLLPDPKILSGRSMLLPVPNE